MMNASQPRHALVDYEASFDSQAAVAWAAEHPDLPVFAVALSRSSVRPSFESWQAADDALLLWV